MNEPGEDRLKEIEARYPSRSVTRRLSVQSPHQVVADLHWALDRLREVEEDRRDILTERQEYLLETYALKDKLAHAEQRLKEVEGQLASTSEALEVTAKDAIRYQDVQMALKKWVDRYTRDTLRLTAKLAQAEQRVAGLEAALRDLLSITHRPAHPYTKCAVDLLTPPPEPK